MDWSLVLKFSVLLVVLIAIAIYLVEHKDSHAQKSVQVSAPDAYSICSLCNRFKSEVSSMVAGEEGSLCSDCLINSALLLNEASRNKDKDVRFIHRLLIASLSSSFESGHRDESLKTYIIEAGAVDPEQRLQILTVANSHANTSLMVELLSQVSREHWTMSDIIFWVYANFNEGEFEEALNHPEVKRGNCTDAEHRVFTLNRIAAKIELMPESGDIIESLAELETVRSFYGKGDYPYLQDEMTVLPNLLGTMAKCHYLLGNYDDALACLNDEIVLCRPCSYRELLRGNIHEKLGQIEAAKSIWQRGVKISERGIFHDELVQKLELLND